MFNLPNTSLPVPVGLLILLELIDITLKAFALWKAIKNNQMYWFVALFIFNTAGLLPLAYMIFFQPKADKKELKVETVKETPKSKKTSKASKKKTSKK